MTEVVKCQALAKSLQPDRVPESARVGLRSPAPAWWSSHVSELAATTHRVASTDSGDQRVFVAVTRMLRLMQIVRTELHQKRCECRLLVDSMA